MMSSDNINNKITNLEKKSKPEKKSKQLKTSRRAEYLWNKGVVSIQVAKKTY